MTSHGRAPAIERPESSDPVVLATNLAPPPIRPEHIERPRLAAAVAAAGNRRLLLVAAPPGFGKSTFLAAWTASLDRPVAWLSIDETENDPVRFVAGLVAAFRTVDHDLGEQALAALRGPAADLLGDAVPALINDVVRSGRDLVLVIEDYHLITSSEVHRAMAYLVERTPAALEVVVSTRNDPPLPLARLRARGELVEVRADDLRFSEAETAEFLTVALGLPLSAADVGLLHARTEGWPAAVYLAALTLRGRPNPSALVEEFAGDDRYVVDYLTSEVLARQTEELRTFLLETAILKRFCGALCDAVTGREDSSDRLAELERSNLLLVPLDTRREWYRYHHLFGDLLLHEAQSTRRAALPELHRRAGSWYRRAGLIVEAAEHAIAAGDLGTVAELIGAFYSQFIDEGQLATVSGWLEAMTEAAVRADWLLGFAGSVVYANAGRTDEAERWLALAQAAPAVERDGRVPSILLAALAGTLRLLRGDVAGTVANERRALAGVPEDAAWTFGPRMVLASGLWWSGQIDEAERVLEAATRIAQRTGIASDLVYALGVRAAVALDREDEATAEALAANAIAEMRRTGLDGHAWTAMAQITHGTLAGRHGDLDAATIAIEHGLALGERLRAWQVTVAANLALAEVRQRKGEATAARRQLARARDILETLPDPGDGFDRLGRTEKLLRLRAPRRAQPAGGRFWELSPRELEVLRLLPSSLSQREIAAELYVSFNTVRTHTRVIFSKLGVTSRPEAVARARELGLL